MQRELTSLPLPCKKAIKTNGDQVGSDMYAKFEIDDIDACCIIKLGQVKISFTIIVEE